jgi:tRNA threonylcarbamoyladenosine modification (KEOPS) complex  Pcc1 subunit
LTYEKSFAITVINGNDAPVEIILVGNQVDENIWRGYTVGTLSAIDLDAGDTVTFSLVEGEGDIDNDSFVIVGNKVVTNAELTFVEDEPLLIRVKATDSSGLSYSQAFEIEVTQSNTQLNDDFKVLTVFFQENIVNNQGDLDALKSKLQLVSNAAAVSPVTPTYTALKADDKVKVNKDGTMTVTFAQPLSINTYRLKIDKDALKDSYNNKSADLITSPFVVDGTGPQIVSVKVAKNKKTITVKFNKRKIAMATAGVKPADVAASFKKAITLTKNSNVATPTYSPLGAKDTVNVSGNNVIITISEGVPPGPNNKLRFAANALKDMGGYKSAVLHTKVELDSVGPLVNKILVEAKNKKITIIFKEKIIQSTAGNGDEKKAALRNAIKLNKTAITNTTNYVPLMADDVILYQQPDRIIITLKNALTGSQNRFRIAQGILKDEFGNLSPNIETSNIVADEVGPALVTSPKVSVNVRVNSGNKIIQVHFNERMYNGSLKASSAEKLADLNKAIQYTLDADVANPIYKSLLTSEKVLIKSKRLEINLSNALPAAKNLKLKISAGAVADLAGNLNLAITTGSFTVDTTGPKLR